MRTPKTFRSSILRNVYVGHDLHLKQDKKIMSTFPPHLLDEMVLRYFIS